MTLTPIDYVLAALCQAEAVGIPLTDVRRAAEDANSAEHFDSIINGMATYYEEPSTFPSIPL